MTRYWIGVASKDHVLRGVAGGFCQLCHGKAQPLKATAPGDRIVYYSPRTGMRAGATVQGFTAIGRIEEGAPYQADMGNGFVPYRMNVAFLSRAGRADQAAALAFVLYQGPEILGLCLPPRRHRDHGNGLRPHRRRDECPR